MPERSEKPRVLNQPERIKFTSGKERVYLTISLISGSRSIACVESRHQSEDAVVHLRIAGCTYSRTILAFQLLACFEA
jgi:hypothetical protein